MRGSGPEKVDSLGTVGLVVVLGDDDLGCSGSRGCGCAARPAVVDDGGDPREVTWWLTSPRQGPGVGSAASQGWQVKMWLRTSVTGAMPDDARWELRAVSSPNHFACSCASVRQPTSTNSAAQ